MKEHLQHRLLDLGQRNTPGYHQNINILDIDIQPVAMDYFTQESIYGDIKKEQKEHQILWHPTKQ